MWFFTVIFPLVRHWAVRNPLVYLLYGVEFIKTSPIRKNRNVNNSEYAILVFKPQLSDLNLHARIGYN